jgi:retron-type reverse transcriptase
MKTHKNLYPQITDFNNLYQAFRTARRGKRHKEAVAAFELDLEMNLWQLYEELSDQTYQPGSYHHFYIYDPKRRLISAAPFGDRVVHHVLCQVIEPIFDRSFIHDSYACRVGKGNHRALERCSQFARAYRHVLKCDIVKYFPSIDHAILRQQLARKIGDAKTLWLIDQIISSGAGVLHHEYEMRWFPGDDLTAAWRSRGLPIGNLTSQQWANVYLNPLDQFVKRELKCTAYLRYCDDFLLFHDDKAQLYWWRQEIIHFLQTLRLTLHEGKSAVSPVRLGVDFVGFRVFPTYRRLRRDNVRRAYRRMRELQAAYIAGEIPLEQVSMSVRSWIAHSQYAASYGLRRQLLGRFAF